MNYLTLIAVVFTSMLFTPTYHNISIPNANKALKSSVLLHMKTKPIEQHRRYGGCSGTYIGPTKILTAAHCFSGQQVEFIWARGVNDRFGYPVKLLYQDQSKDLALLEAPYAHTYVEVGKVPKRGDNIINIGSPLQFEFVISEGIIAALGFRLAGVDKNDVGAKSHYFVTTAMINPGSSGGGVFNEYGQLIGVNTRITGIFGWNGISLAVSTEDINKFLKN